MSTTALHKDVRELARDLKVAGLRFRSFRGVEDFAAMARVIKDSGTVDGNEHVETADDLQHSYQHLVNSDPATDMLMVEICGTLIGYSRVWWQQVVDGPRVYGHFAQLLPAWRGKGIRRVMLRHNESRLRTIAADHENNGLRTYECWASDGERDWIELLHSEGYLPVRYGFEMVRPHLNDIPAHPLPAGLEVRSVSPEQTHQVWAAAREAFRDHWGFCEEEWADDGWFAAWQGRPTFRPELWQVAWDGDEVAGMVLNFIDEAENQEYQRKRGYTETICVRRPWRRQGLARALIARSLGIHKQYGMDEVALGVDAENPSGALQLYESMGYVVTKREAAYRKPLDAELTSIQEG